MTPFASSAKADKTGPCARSQRSSDPWVAVGRLERSRGELGAGDVLCFDLRAGYMDVHLVEIHQAVLLGSEHFGRRVILPKI